METQMPKYYIKSGDLHFTIVSESPRFAAIESLEKCTENPKESPLSLGHYFDVNQTGFDSEPEEQFDTEEIIVEAGWEFEDENDAL
jgi:hypothetical protein